MTRAETAILAGAMAFGLVAALEDIRTPRILNG